MGVLDKVRIVIYRCHEKGLEVFLLSSDLENDPDIWRLPSGESIRDKFSIHQNQMIELEPIQDDKGNNVKTYAIEADWHEIPSIRGMIKHDLKLVKSTIKEIEKGTYVSVKEAFKKVLPNEYRALKELKDIILDKNLLKYI